MRRISGRFYFTCEPGETLLPEVLELVGEDAIMDTSDWPHRSNDFPESSPGTAAVALSSLLRRSFSRSRSSVSPGWPSPTPPSAEM